MSRRTRQPSVFSKVSVKSQTVIPREVRERLVLLDKAPAGEADGFVRDLFRMVERGRREGV